MIGGVFEGSNDPDFRQKEVLFLIEKQPERLRTMAYSRSLTPFRYTLIEQIRCGGAGLGGFLTPTGVGTVVEEGKQTLTLDGKTWLLERPLRADLALIRAHRCDTLGNLTYHLSARNFNPLIALAADITLVEPDELVETGELQPDHIVTPGAVIDHIIVSQESK